MDVSRRLYRRVRPSVATAYRRLLGSRILTRAELLDKTPDGYEIHRFGTDESYDFDRPRHVGELPTVIERKVGECTVPAPFVVEMTDATVIGPSALVDASGHLLLESVLGGYERLIDASVRSLLSGQLPFETRFQRADRRYDEPLFLLVGPWSSEYYHWLTDYLVQVFAIDVYRERTGRDPLVVLPSNPPTWIRKSLSLAGIDPDRTVEWSGDRVRCSRLVLGAARRHTASTNDGFIHSPMAMARLGDRIRGAVLQSDTDTDSRPRRLYVSRADAADRRVRNEDVLMRTLDDYGFDRIVPGERSFAEQVRLFADAEIVLGPHGAGLTNTIFATETTLVELFGSYRNACFFALAEGVGHEYACVTCRSEENDLIVDPADLDTILDGVISSDE